MKFGKLLQKLAGMGGGKLHIISSDDPAEEWKGEFAGSATVMGETEIFYRVKKNYCPRCKAKKEKGPEGNYPTHCHNCGAKYPEGEVISS